MKKMEAQRGREGPWEALMGMDWLVIRTYISESPATLAKAALEGSGIEVVVRKDDCGGMRPYLQAATGVQLLVSKEDCERAEHVLSHAEESMTKGHPDE